MYTESQRCGSKCGMKVHVMMMMMSVCFSRGLPAKLKMYPLTVYNHMMLLICVAIEILTHHRSKLHNYIIGISKQDGCLTFSALMGESSLKSQWKETNTWWVKSIHTGTVRLCCTTDITSGGASEAQLNFTPRHICNFHPEEDVENCHRISAVKGQCEWG